MISVIVPVFNTKNYLDQCVESLVNQTYKDLEILLIDDCSTDGSGEIVDKWADADNRVRAIHNQENLGVSRSRNKGLALAHGEYIVFVDSDDFLAPQMYEQLLKLLDAHQAEVAVSSRYHFIDGKAERKHYLPEGLLVCSGPEALAICMPRIGARPYNMNLWNKLYRRNVLLDDDGEFILFDPAYNFCEDTLWQTTVLRKVEKVVLSDEAYYYYRSQSPGNSRSRLNKASSHAISAISSYLEVYRILRADGNSCAANALQMSLQHRITGMHASLQSKNREVYRFCVKHYFRDLLQWRSLERNRYGAKWAFKAAVWYVLIRTRQVHLFSLFLEYRAYFRRLFSSR